MRAAVLVVATLGVVALPGCVVERRHSDGRVETTASIEVEHGYTYYPSQRAYYCDSCDEWWVVDSGVWVRTRERPQTVVVTEDTPWVVVNVRGPQPQVRYEEHAREYPSNWKSREPKGPPPGRGWRK